ncbi:GILT-like protein 1 [Bradysia coprophila]|uniref:GILT-like protein 1 n=1 Tax=Bradysia coprophila TaxID=38358 RepID=UPI00187D747C|nr:GILT-like protein 1 [Bradysia coprophila]XP_037049799.1 GILT-like protein 1 [Bradysia coprophila]
MVSFLSKGVFITILFAAVTSINAQKLHVAVYYESLCGDSIRFITNQLNPAYDDLKDYIEILFVPFGKSWRNGGETFICQHGPEECAGNMVQSCTLNALNGPMNGNPDGSMAYVACQMAPGAEQSGRVCAEKVGIDFGFVSQCVNGGLGQQLQYGAEKATHEIAYPYPRFVPTIVYNRRFDQKLQNRSLSDFVGVVCELIRNQAPVCSRR